MDEPLPQRVYGTVEINGIQCPVTNMVDISGDDTDDIEQAFSAVALYPGPQWIAFDVDATGIWPLQ